LHAKNCYGFSLLITQLSNTDAISRHRFPNPGWFPSHEGIASPEAAKKRQDQPVGDNYLATNGDGMECEFVLLSLALESSQPNIEI
jgi:hypothetical protein